MKKAGQPDNALEITAGRSTLRGLLFNGLAQRESMSMAANWIRDLYTHHRIPVRCLEGYEVYRQLMAGTATSHDMQKIVLTWINDLVDGNLTWSEKDNQMPELPNDANARQVGGDHYKKPIQHWDFAASNGYDYLLGQVTKYLFRWRDKNGLQDVEKAAHFLQKAGEVFSSDMAPISIGAFLDANNVVGPERTLFLMLHAYHDTNDPVFLIEAQRLMNDVLVLAGGAPLAPQG